MSARRKTSEADREAYRQEFLALNLNTEGETEEEKRRWNMLCHAGVSEMSAAAFRQAFNEFMPDRPLTSSEIAAITGKSKRSVMRAAAELKQFLDAGLGQSVTVAPPLGGKDEPIAITPPLTPTLPPWGGWEQVAPAPAINEAQLIQAVQTVLESWKEYGRDTIPFPLRVAVYERDGYTCVECGRNTHLSIDHCIAVTSGGETIFENLRTLCRPCNSRKHARNVRPVS